MSVSQRPRAGVPAVEADLFDGSGHLTVVFLGRRTIAGIEPGRRIIATGRVNGDESPQHIHRDLAGEAKARQGVREHGGERYSLHLLHHDER